MHAHCTQHTIHTQLSILSLIFVDILDATTTLSCGLCALSELIMLHIFLLRPVMIFKIRHNMIEGSKGGLLTPPKITVTTP